MSPFSVNDGNIEVDLEKLKGGQLVRIGVDLSKREHFVAIILASLMTNFKVSETDIPGQENKINLSVATAIKAADKALAKLNEVN